MFMPSQCVSRTGEASNWWVSHGRGGKGAPIDPPHGCSADMQRAGEAAFRSYVRLDEDARHRLCDANGTAPLSLDGTLVMHMRAGDVFPPPGGVCPSTAPVA